MERYKYLHGYVLAAVIGDLTDEFCKRYINPKSRTVDQIVQAARSGKQNIAEGASSQSMESYIKLVSVAEASFKELLSDYEDFLRHSHLPVWAKNDPRVQKVRVFRAGWSEPNKPNTPNMPNNPELFTNCMITLCQMETYLLRRLNESLKQKFVEKGGFRENLHKQRTTYKNKPQACHKPATSS